LTGLAGPDERARAAAAGFDAHVAKPIDLDTLIQTVLELVAPRRQAAHC
jgi:two-component system CheB/CheR fusion protein